MRTHKEVRERLLSNPRVRAEYEALEPEFQFRRALIHMRIAKGMSQEDLAEKLGTKQAFISRLETGRANISLAYLGRLADVLDADVSITFKPRDIIGLALEAPLAADFIRGTATTKEARGVRV